MSVPRPSGVRRLLARLRRPPLVPTLLALVTLLAGGLYALPLRSGPPAVPLQLEGGEVVVYGPKRVESPSGGTVYQVEKFTLALQPGARYTLRVQNGAADGSARLDSARVVLNGSTVLTGRELHRGAASASRVIEATGSNTVEVRATGTSGTFLTLSVVQEPDPTYTVFGPKTYVRETGAPVTLTEQFTLQPGAGGPYRLHVVNGNPDGTQRLASAQVRLNGVNVMTSSDLNQQVGGLVREVSLQEENTVEVTVEAKPSGRMTIRFTATDTTAPMLTITAPAVGLVTRATEVSVAGSVKDETAVQVSVGGVAATMNGSAFSATVPLANEGRNKLVIHATDAAGLQTDSVRVVIRDTQPPVVSLAAPAEGAVTGEATVVVRGTVADSTAATVNVNGVQLAVDESGGFTGSVPLTEGTNILTVSATDQAGNSTSLVRQVVFDAGNPKITITAPAEGETTSGESIQVTGVVQAASGVTLTVNGAPVAVGAGGTFTHTVALSQGPNTITVVATSGAGRATTATRSVTRTSSEPVPPDPSTVAPALDRTVATNLAAATQFLYSGANPIQTGVAPGTINPVRVVVLRGRVLTREGQPLPGVKVSIQGQPQYGSTTSRADGAFDLAVNGGGMMTLYYAKAGYLPAQRTLETPWQEFLTLDDVALVRLDPQVTAIDFSDPAEVARGSVQTDADGSRQATLLFEQGTVAEMVLPDGTRQPLPSVSVRATEFTVGENGRKAMPADLPPTSGYTYAVELSVDEALAAGASSVQFSRPVAFYVENFLGFPVGMSVPMGWYDRERAQWVPEQDGVIIKILGAGAGLAEVDTNGDGLADDPASLAARGIDDAERARLATLYPAGRSLWRVQTKHFSWIDLNYPRGSPDARPPRQDPPERDDPKDCNNTASGSIIECQSQVLGERLGVLGTRLTLDYRSDRVFGRVGARTLRIPLSGASVPVSLRRIDLVIEVAGRRFTQSFPAQANQSFDFVWDGKDAYGRQVQGPQPATVRVGYAYPLYYLAPPSAVSSFGLSCSPSATDFWQACIIPTTLNSSARQEDVQWQTSRTHLGIWDAKTQGLGGWTVSEHHTYDPVSRVVHRGDGGRVSADDQNNVIRSLSSLDAYSATVAPDGSVYVAEWSTSRVRKVSPDGTITTIAGNGTWGCSGDGGPATAAQLYQPDGVSLGLDGSIYIEDSGNHRIRRIGPDGIITTFAGNGSCSGSTPIGPSSASVAQADPAAGDSIGPKRVPVRAEGEGVSTLALGDGGPANQANLNTPYGVAAAPDGSVYIADGMNNRIRKVTPDGIITTVAGTGLCCFGGDGGPATAARLNFPWGVTLGPDGSLYIADTGNNRIRRVTPDGIITTVAGNGFYSFGGDGGPATGASFRNPDRVAVAADGSIYIPDSNNYRLRRVGPDGIITTVAGDGFYNFGGDGGPAAGAQLRFIYDVSIAPDGTLYVADTGNQRVRRILPVLPGFNATDVVIASEDGDEYYQFDAAGRHLSTRSALTGAVLRRFSYGAGGLLTGITDGDGQVTTIERGADGAPQAIVGPFGHRTGLSLDPGGFLAGITNPAGEQIRASYSGDGLLTGLNDPKNNPRSYAFDAAGRLTGASNPAGGSSALGQAADGSGSTISIRSGLGLTSAFRIQQLSNGNERRVDTNTAGLSTVTTFGTNGVTERTAPDGTRVLTLETPDPRFGMQAPVQRQTVIITPGGRTMNIIGSSQVTPASAADPLSLRTRADAMSVNGRVFSSSFDAQTRRVTTTTPVGRQFISTIDSLGRVVQEQAPGIASASYQYDARGLLTGQARGARQWTYSYDAKGRLATATDPLSRTESYVYDDADRLVRQVLANGREIRYGYDQNGNLTSLTPSGRPAHVFGHTALDQVESYGPPELGAAAATRYRYNLDGQIERVTRPDGLEVQIGYDAAGRLGSVTTPTGQFGYNFSPATGNLASITAPGGNTLSYGYDGSLPTQVTWSGVVSGRVEVRYNNDLMVTTQKVNGDSIAFQYDRDGLVTQAGALAITRNAQNGLVTGSTLGTVARKWSYDTLGELAGDTVTIGATPLYQSSYSRDHLERITGLAETIGGVTSAYAYGYDEMGRLQTVTRNGVAVESYAYDDNGNRTSFTSPQGALTGAYDAQDRLLSYGEATYSYTANGELQAKVSGSDTTRYHYDVAGNLLSASLPNGTRIEYVIDGQNRRIGKKVDGSVVQGFLYGDQLSPVAELNGAGQVVSRFVYGTGSSVPDYMVRGGTTYRLVSDHRGSVRLVVNAGTGEVAQRIDYDAYGRVTLDSNPGFQPFGFAGGLLDGHTGLVRFGARDYDANSGRWTAKDPIGFSGGDPNLYGYVSGDPVNFVDPNGLAATWGGCAAKCGAEVLGVDDLVDVGLIGAGQPIPGTKPFVTPGSSRGTSVAGMVADGIFGGAKSPVRLPTIVGGPGTGRKLAIAGTRSIARFAGRAVPFVGWGLLAADGVQFGVCMAKCLNDDNCK